MILFFLFCLALCFLLFILGVPMTTQGGAYIFQVFISTKLNTKCDTPFILIGNISYFAKT